MVMSAKSRRRSRMKFERLGLADQPNPLIRKFLSQPLVGFLRVKTFKIFYKLPNMIFLFKTAPLKQRVNGKRRFHEQSFVKWTCRLPKKKFRPTALAVKIDGWRRCATYGANPQPSKSRVKDRLIQHAHFFAN